MTDKPKVTQADTVADHVLMKRGLYYCPNNAGYTGRKDRAGLYPASDARPDCGVTAIPFKDAPLFAPKCWDEVKVEYYEERIAAEQSRDDVIEECAKVADEHARIKRKYAHLFGDTAELAGQLKGSAGEFEALARTLRNLKGKKS